MTPIVLLAFGSRDATIEAPFARVLDTLRPDLVIHGACGLDENDEIDPDRMKGADGIAHRLAGARGILIRPFPAAWKRLGKRAGMERNRHQYLIGRPSLAMGQIVGRVGTKMSPGSAGMLGVCLRGIPAHPPCPVVVYRDNGIEPHAHLGVALSQLRRLYAVTRDPALIIPGQALASHCEIGEPPADEVLAALAYAREGSRWAPWIEAVEATVKKGA